MYAKVVLTAKELKNRDEELQRGGCTLHVLISLPPADKRKHRCTRTKHADFDITTKPQVQNVPVGGLMGTRSSWGLESESRLRNWIYQEVLRLELQEVRAERSWRPTTCWEAVFCLKRPWSGRGADWCWPPCAELQGHNFVLRVTFNKCKKK